MTAISIVNPIIEAFRQQRRLLAIGSFNEPRQVDGRARTSKNSAWLTTAFTAAT